MWIKQRRARRLAAVRRHLAGLPVREPPPVEVALSMGHLECVGREHLVGAGTWLVAAYLRASKKT
jgi:hypothetical protein